MFVRDRHDGSSVAPFFGITPFAADRAWRAERLSSILAELTVFHYNNCTPYRTMLEGVGFDARADLTIADLPYLPIGLFKQSDLISVPRDQVQHVLTSSGTSAAGRSRIAVDRATSILQMRALAAIVAHFIGDKPLPLLIVDAPPAAIHSPDYAARTVALRGFSLFASGPPHYALSADMQLARPAVDAFLTACGRQPFLVFGFTHIVWTHLLAALEAAPGRPLNLTGGTLIHGGGWKRLNQAAVDDRRFRTAAYDKAGLSACYNYYGMVEQAGSIYMQCKSGHFHCSCFSEVFIRRVGDFSLCNIGEAGFVQTLSILPHSYPGHNLLTEDVGVLRGEDDCSCGLVGKYFDVIGRAQSAMPKGCGDV